MTLRHARIVGPLEDPFYRSMYGPILEAKDSNGGVDLFQDAPTHHTWNRTKNTRALLNITQRQVLDNRQNRLPSQARGAYSQEYSIVRQVQLDVPSFDLNQLDTIMRITLHHKRKWHLSRLVAIREVLKTECKRLTSDTPLIILKTKVAIAQCFVHYTILRSEIRGKGLYKNLFIQYHSSKLLDIQVPS
jgi:hypothetical protein